MSECHTAQIKQHKAFCQQIAITLQSGQILARVAVYTDSMLNIGFSQGAAARSIEIDFSQFGSGFARKASTQLS
jgi:hypothetical protein